MHFLLVLAAFSFTVIQSQPDKGNNSKIPATHTDEATTQKAKPKPPAISDINGAQRNENSADEKHKTDSNPDSTPRKVEISPNPFVIAPQPTDPYLKIYVWLTGVIAVFSIVAALAAIRQANATRQKERAWIIARMEEQPQSLLGPEPNAPIAGVAGVVTIVTNILRIACIIENQGSSPAWLTARAERLQVVAAQDDWTKELPASPEYGSVTNLGDYGATMPPNAMLPAIFYLNPSDALPIEQGNKALYVYGFVKYRDAFKKRHEMRYCFRFKVALGVTDPASRGFYIAGPPAYNKST